MEPISMIVAAGIALGGWALGHLTGRRLRKAAGPPAAICEGCAHGLSFHDANGRCHGIVRRDAFGPQGGYLGPQDYDCTCQQYVGPIPADRLLASFTYELPPGAPGSGREG